MLAAQLRWRIDAKISRESIQPEGSQIEPPFRESRFGAQKIANRTFEAIRANRPNVMKLVLYFLRTLTAVIVL